MVPSMIVTRTVVIHVSYEFIVHVDRMSGSSGHSSKAPPSQALTGASNGSLGSQSSGVVLYRTIMGAVQGINSPGLHSIIRKAFGIGEWTPDMAAMTDAERVDFVIFTIQELEETVQHAILGKLGIMVE